MFTIGTDTEFFLQRKGNLVSAIDIIEGSKRNPQELSNGGALTHDNVAMEFATPVADSEETFIKSIQDTLRESLSHLPDGVCLNTKASANFPIKELDTEEARQFGCDPDYDAWAIRVNTPPEEAVFEPFRCVGGHLHIGFVPESGNDFLLDPYGKIEFVKALDLMVGVTLTIFDNSKEAKERRKLYGKAGCHRPTPYGVEYRSLSNFWTLSPNLVRLVYSLTADTLILFQEGKCQKALSSLDPEKIQAIINDGDRKEALKVWKGITKNLVSAKTIENFSRIRATKKIDIYKEWGLG